MATPTPGIVLPPPVVRVGILIDVPRVSIGADSGVVVRVAGRPEPIRLARATFASASNQPPSPPRYRVQVASLADERGARPSPSACSRRPDSFPASSRASSRPRTRSGWGTTRTRDEALRLATRLGRSGLSGSWVVEERPLPGAGGRLRLLETGDEMEAATIEPAVAAEILSADASPYRGLLEVRAAEGSALTVSTSSNIEDYLRGVVPNELSPQAFPQIGGAQGAGGGRAQLRAQPQGQFEQVGYDICATPACQVYRGRGHGDPLHGPRGGGDAGARRHLPRAAHQRALHVHLRRPHRGRGEHVRRRGDPLPEGSGLRARDEGVEHAQDEGGAPRGAGQRRPSAATWRSSSRSGVLEPRTYSAPVLAGVPSDAEIRGWASRLETALHRRGCDAHVAGALARRGHFVQYLVGTLCWEERGGGFSPPRTRSTC